jgi:hypothetical protein
MEDGVYRSRFGCLELVCPEATGLHRKVGFNHQTVWYRAPEVVRRKLDFGQAIDIWSVGCVFAELCGEVFHRLPVQTEEVMLQEYERQWTAIEATGRKSWPASVRLVIGSIGEFLLDACLAVDPRDRPSASQAANHMYLHPERLGLGGTVEGDRLAERGFVPLVAPKSFRGTRHDWNVLAGNVGVETVEWLRRDFANKEHLKVDFEAARGDAKSEAGLKYILAGKMVEEPASMSMCTLSIAKVLPLPRLRAFWAAFKGVNREVLQEFNRQARAAAVATSPEGEDKNKSHFMQHTLDSWLGSSGELCVVKSGGTWAEQVHQDGGASVVHCGITLFGDRRLVCQRPDDTSVVIHNTPGTVYIGGLTGPTHGVTHVPSAADQLLDGEHSVSVMLRTALFPHCQSRVRATTPCPQGFFFAISASFADSFSRLTWQFPSLGACTAEFDRAAAVALAKPQPKAKAEAGPSPTAEVKPKAPQVKKSKTQAVPSGGPAKRARQ